MGLQAIGDSVENTRHFVAYFYWGDGELGKRKNQGITRETRGG